MIPVITEAAGMMAGGIIRFIAFEVLLLLVSAFFIWIGARVAEVKEGSLGRSFVVAVILAIIVPLLVMPFAGLAAFTMVLSVILTLAIIKLVFGTGWKKSLITWVFSIIAQIISLAILVFVLVLI